MAKSAEPIDDCDDAEGEESISVELQHGEIVSVTLTGVMISSLTPRERRLVCRLLDTMEKLCNPPTAGEN